MEFESGERREKIRVFVSKEEKLLFEMKASYYGYSNLSEYIRDASIYEKVTYVDLENRNVIYQAFSDNTNKLNKISKELRHTIKYATQLSDDDAKNILAKLSDIFKEQKNILKLIEKKLDLDVWIGVNRNRSGGIKDAIHQKTSTS